MGSVTFSVAGATRISTRSQAGYSLVASHPAWALLGSPPERRAGRQRHANLSHSLHCTGARTRATAALTAAATLAACSVAGVGGCKQRCGERATPGRRTRRERRCVSLQPPALAASFSLRRRAEQRAGLTAAPQLRAARPKATVRARLTLATRRPHCACCAWQATHHSGPLACRVSGAVAAAVESGGTLFTPA